MKLIQKSYLLILCVLLLQLMIGPHAPIISVSAGSTGSASPNPTRTLLSPHPTASTGYTIHVFSTNDPAFLQELSLWDISGTYNSPGYYICNGDYLIGGYGILFPNSAVSGLYITLPKHNMIYFSYSLYILDTMDPIDYFNFNLDSKVFKVSFVGYDHCESSDLCGSGYPDTKTDIYGMIAHSSPTLLVKFTIHQDSDPFGESYGFRNIALQLATRTVPKIDAICMNTICAKDISVCSCPQGQYSSNKGQCSFCHPRCATCFGPYSSDCYECSPGYEFDGNVCSVPIPQDDTSQTLIKASGPFTGTLVGFIGVSSVSLIVLKSTSTLWSLIGFQQFVGYLLYINIDYPFQTKILLEALLKSSIWSFIPNPMIPMTSSLYAKFLASPEVQNTDLQPPEKYVEQENVVFFVENGVVIMLVNLVLLILLLIIISLHRLPSLTSSRMLKRIRETFQWNLIARTYLENAIPLSAAICLQCFKLVFNNTYITLCSALAMISAVYLVVMFVWLFRAVNKRRKDELLKGQTQAAYGTLYEGMNLEAPGGKYYHLVILLRGFLITLLTVFAESNPLMQISALILYNIGLVYYMFMYTAFQGRLLNIMFKGKEVFVLVIEICVLCLFVRTPDASYYDRVGWIIFGLVFGVLTIECLYNLGIQIYGIPQMYRKAVGMCKRLRGRPTMKDARIRQPRALRFDGNESSTLSTN